MLPDISPNCPYCPRLAQFREANRVQYPHFYNAPVPSFGAEAARMLIVGLAPGLKGANQTGRPFTGDYAGIVLYQALLRHGFARGDYKESADDGLMLVDCRITNAVRCVPPLNKPDTAEIHTCNQFLKQEMAAMPNITLILSLGLISHNAVLKALGYKMAFAKFAHGGVHVLGNGITLLDSYHCSRYNINTGALTVEMFDAVVDRARTILKEMV